MRRQAARLSSHRGLGNRSRYVHAGDQVPAQRRCAALSGSIGDGVSLAPRRRLLYAAHANRTSRFARIAA
jgi:hypothetical protein